MKGLHIQTKGGLEIICQSTQGEDEIDILVLVETVGGKLNYFQVGI